MSAQAAIKKFKWQCKHCDTTIKLPPAASFEFCPVCKEDVRDMFVESNLTTPMQETVTSDNVDVPDKNSSTGASIQRVPLIEDTQPSPPPPPPVIRTRADAPINTISTSPPDAGLYPKLPSMEEINQSLTLLDERYFAQSAEKSRVSKKRQREDSENATSQLQKKMCDTEDPSSPPKETVQSPSTSPQQQPLPPPSPQESPSPQEPPPGSSMGGNNNVQPSMTLTPSGQDQGNDGKGQKKESEDEEFYEALGDFITVEGRRTKREKKKQNQQKVFGRDGAASSIKNDNLGKTPFAGSSRSDRSGANVNATLLGLGETDCVTVIFNVIVPRDFWPWDESTTIHLRFGDYRLGDWSSDVGSFKCLKKVGENKYWMQCTLNIKQQVLHYSRIPYKYVVTVPNLMGSKYQPYEFLHQCKTQEVFDRVLEVPAEIKNKFSVYDGMIFPETQQPASFLRRMGGAVRDFFIRSQDSEKPLPIPHHEQIQEECLQHFLDNHRQLLKNLVFSKNKQKITYSMCVKEIYNIFQQLRHQSVCKQRHRGAPRVAGNLPKVLKTWLIEVAKDLKSMEIHDNARRMCSVLVILGVFYRSMSWFFRTDYVDSSEIAYLFAMLHLRQEPGQSHVSDLEVLRSFVSDDYCVDVADMLLYFTELTLSVANPTFECVYIIPLIHILQGRVKPFDIPALTSDNIKWTDRKIQLYKLRSAKFPSILKENYSILEPLIRLDPLLLPLLVNVSRMDDLPDVFSVIPTYLAVAKLFSIVKSIHGHLSAQQADMVSNLVQSTLTVAKSSQSHLKEFKEAAAVFDEVQGLFLLLVGKKFSSPSYPNANLLHRVISLLFYTCASVRELSTEKFTSEAEQLTKKMWEQLSKSIAGDWIVCHFSPKFGDPEKGIFRKAKEDIQIFEHLAAIDCPTQEIQERWCSDVLKAILAKRVARVPQILKIELMVTLEKLDNAHPIIVDVFVEAVVQSFEIMQCSEKLQRLYDQTEKYRRTVGSVLGKIFKKKFPHGLQSVSIDDLLSWESWPVCISIRKSEMRINSGKKENENWFSDECDFFCSLADSTLTNMIQRIFSGAISLQEMEGVYQKLPQVEKLCIASSRHNWEYNWDDVKTAMINRYRECVAFKRYKEILTTFCLDLETQKLNIEGLSDLTVEFSNNHSMLPINSLCCIKPSPQFIPPQFICFEPAKPLQPILNSYRILSDIHWSDLFSRIWKSALKTESKTNLPISFSDVVTRIWNPVYAQCCQLISDVEKREIKLIDVDKYFGHYKGGDEIFDHLLSLYSGLELCVDKKVKETRWIRTSVGLMEQYWALCGQAEAANIILDLKESLHLTGNFDIIEHVANQITQSMKESSLRTIDHKLIDARSFLEEMSASPWKLNCLRQFAACSSIIEWIRKETKEVNDLHKFVSVALHTAAGEGDLSSDRLSHLKMVGSGFGPLIYGLIADSSFESFRQKCKDVWTAVEQAPTLPIFMVACNDELEWYKSVKETQASVEVTSFGQMNNIFQYGHYTVGSDTSKICHHYHQVIHLKLTERKKRLTKDSYNLEELRDLESKLVLITGSKAENRAHVDTFIDTLHSICRIAEVLLTLQQIGNVKYTGWTLRVPCSTNRLMIAELQKQAKEMEDELSRWKEIVRCRREEFYELNYFNTMQLLALRRELGKLNNRSVSPDVLVLLHSISSQISSELVSDAVYQVTNRLAKLPEVEMLPDAETEDIPPHADDEISGSNLQLPNEAMPCDSAKIIPDKHLLNLTEDDLSPIQKEMMTTISSRVGCSKQLVLMAFEECSGDESDRYDFEKWCTNNIDRDILTGDVEDEESLSGSDSEASSDSDESIHEDKKFKYFSSSAVTVVSPQASSGPRIIMIEKTAEETVDENNPIVLDLVSAGYTVEQSIDAVEKYRTLEAALNYLETGGEVEEEGEPDVISVLQHQQISREDSDGSVNMDRDEGNITIQADPDAESNYLRLEYLGEVLKHLSIILPGDVKHRRTFPKEFLKEGYPNLIVVQPDHILRTTLSLYMEDHYEHPLPTPEEVLVCNSATTAEEIELFWMRTINDPDFRRIFCLVHAEKLSYKVSDLALSSLSKHSQGEQGYRLVIISSNEEEEASHFISKLHLYRRPFISQNNPSDYRNFLAAKLTKNVEGMDDLSTVPASFVDYQNSCVRIVSSDRSGMGKSLYVQRLAESLSENSKRDLPEVIVTVPLHGPMVTPDTVLQLFMGHFKKPSCCIYHIDIAPNVLWEVDTILFSLLILRGLCDSQGRVWRCHPNQLYVVEITKPDRDNVPQRDKVLFPENRTLALLDLLPSVSCLSPRTTLKHFSSERQDQVVMDENEFRSCSFQRVYQYIRRYTAGQKLDTFSYADTVEGTPQDCVEQLLQYCGVKAPSWSEIRHFVRFLDLQLQSCENSVFTDPAMIGDVMEGLKGFVVKFMIRMSRDFSTSSLEGEVALEMREAVEQDDIDKYQISKRKRWEQNPHPYIFFNQDGMSITFVGFTVNKHGDLTDPVGREVIEQAIMTTALYKGLLHNRVNFADNHQNWTKDIMIVKIATVMGVEFPHDPDSSYVLTVDNVIKILAIQMRFRCGIPVVIMGETGCGKTRLIRYMCDLARQGMENNNMLILKVHGGTTEKDIAGFIQKAEQESESNRLANMDTVVFFDEANTTDAIGLIKEIMCDHRINGKPISKDLKFIAACNPYRKHTPEMIQRLENAGLGFFVRETETQQKLGKVPLRQLVYRVLDLPPSLRPLVYDFGQLNTDTESDYIRQIVHDHIRLHPKLSAHLQQISAPISNVLTKSQAYMRNKKNECSFVSLRDVERAMIVFEYLYKMMDVFGPLMDEWAEGGHRHIENEDDDLEDFQGYVSPGPIARALVLSLSLCYHARLEEREEYEQIVVACFTGSITLPGGAEQFRDEIRWCQEVLLDHMQLDNNIAKNAALRENVFMMAICVELRIPLFLVGKPGSSKSLAKSIISESMKGKDSKRDLLKNFKEVEIFSYQCSQLSTSDSVIEVFHTASNFQKKQDKSSYVAVVVLDEVGLAEDSPFLPLKALHPLLEDGTEGAGRDYTDEVVDREDRVAFIGISNWALDPAKMNRGVMVTRGDPSEDELVFSAMGICSNKDNDPIRSNLEMYFRSFARAYKKILGKQEREFFGLRDFYSMIKMLYYMCEKSKRPLTWPQLEHAIKRNFGGLESKKLNPFKEFQEEITMSRELPPGCPPELLHIMNPDCSRLGLIKTSLGSRERTWHGENRYVLFLTENYAALDILKNPKNYLSHEMSASIPGAGASEQHSKDIQPYILFGSSFPKDKEYTQVCRNINQIKICMETGRTVILLNLENLYESLYDVLNQYYIFHADSKYVDLGLQTHRVRCRVDNNFKLILIAEKDTVYDKFPTPLINRLEKHFVLTSSILEQWQEIVLTDFEKWIKKFAFAGDSKFKESDAFIGFQKDTPASVVFQATNLLRSDGMEQYEDIVKTQWNPEDIVEEVYVPTWEECVLSMSKFLLLQTAAPDAIVRLERTDLAGERKVIEDIYFRQQHHSSIEDFLNHHIHDCEAETGLLMQVTTHSHLLSHDELQCVKDTISIDVAAFLLNEFDTELDFSNKISPTFKVKEDGIPEKHLVIIQCDSGHMNGDLIACARYRIYDLKVKADQEKITHVLFIIHLPHQVASSSFVGFQGNPWISSHIDDLRPTTDNAVSAQEAIGLTISELFLGRAKSETLVGQNYDSLGASYASEHSFGENISGREELTSDAESEVQKELSQYMDVSQDELMEIERDAPRGTQVLDIENEELEYEDVNVKNGKAPLFIRRSVEDVTSEHEDAMHPSRHPGDAFERDEEESLFQHSVEDMEPQLEQELHHMEGEKNEENPGVIRRLVEDVESDHRQGGVDQSEHSVEDKRLDKPELDLLSIQRAIQRNNASYKQENFVRDETAIELTSVLPNRSPMYCRLQGCIQAAASKLKDFDMKRCTKRVEILVRLIPKELPKKIDTTQFHGVLIQHIFNILQQRDDVRLDEKQWVVTEAMNPKSLQHGGTFRNVLSRKVDEVVIPIFSEIISIIDQNYNLNLIDPKKENTPLSMFWLLIFHDAQLMQFNYTDMVTPREQIPGLGGRKSVEDFVCELPFSWLVFEAMRSQWDNAKSAAVEDRVQLYNQLCATTNIGEVLSSVGEFDCEDFYRKYLHDFVRLAHRCKHSNKEDDIREYDLIACALDALVHGDGFCSVDGNITLLHRITALHVVDQMNLSQIMWFSQLVSLSPGIMVHLNATNVSDKDEMVLHLVAVEQALNSLTPPLNKTDPACNLVPWLIEVRAAQNAITSIINLPCTQTSSGDHNIQTRLRSKWASIQIMQCFLEQVLLKHEFQNSVAFLIRLELHLRSQSNFLNMSTLKMVQSHLNRMEKEVKSKKLIKGKELLRAFKKHCQSYFLEVVSSLCFGGQSAPEEALIKMLMEVVFTENATREITHVADAKTDVIPVVRSSLLQLLLEHDSVSVKDYLEEYFARSQRALGGAVDQNLYLLCIQCFEDALNKQHSGRPLEHRIDATIAILDNSHLVLGRFKEEHVINIGYLEGVAGMRFAMMEVATVLHMLFNMEQDLQQRLQFVKLITPLLNIAEEVCGDEDINTTNFTVGDAIGPAVYLLKLLVRQHGFDCLMRVSTEHQWVVPEGLRNAEQEQVIDPFVIYKGNFDYTSLRTVLCETLHRKEVVGLEDATKDLDIREAVILLLGIYQTITLSFSSARPTMDDDLREDFGQFVLSVPAFSLPMRRMSRLLLSNEQGGPLAQLRVTPELPAMCKTLGAIVVHTVAVLDSCSRRPSLLPFVNMMTNPAALANAYMPTMPEDQFIAILQVLRANDKTGRFCVCPRGHRYYIGNCGGAVTMSNCNVCGSAIGGINYNLAAGNQPETDQTDKTKTGHALGSPESRTATPAPERFLSPPAVCIVRAIMHSALLWCSCHREDVMHDIAHLVTPFVNPQQLPEFFWMHLSKDIEHLSRVTGKGIEDSTIIVHLVLSEILTNTTPDSEIIATVNSLNAKNAREHWEKEFSARYIQPVLGQLDARLNVAMDAITSDDKQEHDQLFFLAYEKVKVEEHSMEPHLWSYRQRISLEHLGQTLQEKRLREKYPILHEFLSVEPSLRATQYLPDVVKLQRSLYDAFHHRLDRKDAKTMTIDQFLQGLMSENSRNEYRERIESLKKAFSLVGNNLKTHSRLPLEEQHCLPVITEDVPLEYLIPTTSGAGVLTTSLVDYLILTHNNFIEKCCGKVAEISQGAWAKHKVPITHIHQCHLLDYEHQIVSVVLSHCRYSLKLGEAHTVRYDHQALEKHILDKFIYGKPIILSDIPQVMYRRDIYTTVTFNQVRKNVNPQERLEPRVQREIIAELRTPDRLRENLDVVDIVLGFLSSGGGRAEKPLGEYVDKVLKMKRRPFSQKAREYCHLKHVLSLWETLSVGLSRQTWLRSQEPFDSVHIKYMRDLSEEDGDNQKKALDKCLRAFDLDRLLGALFEFVETHVKYSPDNELRWPVCDVLVEDQFKHLDMEEHFSKEFPGTITLDQTVAAWKHIVQYQERQKLDL